MVWKACSACATVQLASTAKWLLATNVTLISPVSRSATRITGGELRESSVDGKYVAPSSPSNPRFDVRSSRTFGGGLALYNSSGKLVGGIGVSGDTSCADHFVAWVTRALLKLDNVPAGVNNGTDNVIYDITNGVSTSGFGHPECSHTSTVAAFFLTRSYPTGPHP